MPDWITDQQPFETPLAAAAPGYESIAPTGGQAFGALFEESSPITWLERAYERGEHPGSSWFDRALVGIGEANSGLVQTPPDNPSVLPADEINKMYAPPGTTITNQPMDEGLARVISKQKYEDIQRQGILSRYAENTGPLARFATGTAAFLLDPLNLSTAFIPGAGEEAVLGKLGYSGLEAAPFGAKVLARGVSGFTGGAAAQAPLAGVHYGLSQEEGGDYGLRQAALDIAFSGGLNAAFHAGITGPAGDLFRRDQARVSPVDQVAEALPQTRYEAMSAAVSQMVDGREIDTTAIFGEKGLQDVHALARQIDPETFAKYDDLISQRDNLREQVAEEGARRTMVPKAKAAQSQIDQIVGIEQSLTPEERTSWIDAWRASASDRDIARLDEAQSRFDEIVRTDTPAQAAARERLQNVDFAMRDLAPLVSQAYRQAQEQAAAPHVLAPPDIAQAQQRVYANGYAPGIPQNEFDRANEAIYAPEKEENVPRETVAAKPEATTAARPKTETEVQLADLEQKWEAAKSTATLAPEEKAELDHTGMAVERANKQSAAYEHAAGCLGRAGV